MPERQATPVTRADATQAERLHVFAHDLKNRLTGLWEGMRVLRSGGDGTDAAELEAFMERCYFSAQRDIEALLDDLQVDRSIAVSVLTPTALGLCIQVAMAQESYRLQAKEQSVQVHMEATDTALADQVWTQRILASLLSNASKFSSVGARINIRLVDLGECLGVEVSDEGVGLNQTDIDHIFTRYAILSSRPTKGEQQARGTLARAKDWARAQNGDLLVHSAGPDRGCTFTLVLPALAKARRRA